MARQTIGIGSSANDGTGDPLRDAFDKTNDNFAELYVHGARVKFSADQTAQDFTAGAALAWNAEDFDTDTIHDNSTAPSRLTVPSGFSYARVECGIYVQSFTASGTPLLLLRRNGTTFCGHVGHNPSTNWGIVVSSGLIAVSASQYFEAFMQVSGDASIDILAARSFFSIQLYP